MSEVFVFPWQVATGGHEWIETKAVRQPQDIEYKDWFLTVRTPPFTARRYPPLQEYPALFRVFIDTPPTREGILSFANEYGLLGTPVSTRILLPTGQATLGESFEEWMDELSWLKQMVSLWDLVQAGSIAEIARYIRRNETGVYYSYPPEIPNDAVPSDRRYYRLIADNDDSETLARLQPGDVGQPAWFCIQRVINEHLRDRVSPRLLWNEKWTALGLYMMPVSLIGALWLQFAQAVAGNKAYHRCEYCGKWFEVSLDASRPTRIYCSDACRFKAYRKRQEDAYQFDAQGIPLKEIAKRLGTDTMTAKKWIKKGKEKRDAKV